MPCGNTARQRTSNGTRIPASYGAPLPRKEAPYHDGTARLDHDAAMAEGWGGREGRVLGQSTINRRQPNVNLEERAHARPSETGGYGGQPRGRGLQLLLALL